MYETYDNFQDSVSLKSSMCSFSWYADSYESFTTWISLSIQLVAWYTQQAFDRVMNVEVEVIIGLLFCLCFCREPYPQIGRGEIRQMCNGAIDKFAGTEILRNAILIEFDIRSLGIIDAGLRPLYREKVAELHTVSVNFDPVPEIVTMITIADRDKA